MTRPVHGLRAWALQRVSALYLLGFVLYMGWRLLVHPPADYQAWRQWVARPGPSLALAVFFLSLLVHAWVGVRDVVMDYIGSLPLRIGLLIALVFGLVFSGVWVARILFSVSVA